jgi:hypothetical protein
MSDVLASMKWPKLEHFRICNCASELESFVGFMERHAVALAFIEVHNIRLANGQLDVEDATSVPIKNLVAWEIVMVRLAPKIPGMVVYVYSPSFLALPINVCRLMKH